jgi:hypothetical protein
MKALKLYIKCKVFPVQTLKVYKGVDGVASSFLNLSTIWGEFQPEKTAA